MYARKSKNFCKKNPVVERIGDRVEPVDGKA